MERDLQQAYEIWDAFLREWPLERLRTMPLPEYSAAGQSHTFTAWIENRLDKLGSIWGGSAFKFGIEDWRRIQEVFNDLEQPDERQIVQDVDPAVDGVAGRDPRRRFRINPAISPAARCWSSPGSSSGTATRISAVRPTAAATPMPWSGT